MATIPLSHLPCICPFMPLCLRYVLMFPSVRSFVPLCLRYVLMFPNVRPLVPLCLRCVLLLPSVSLYKPLCLRYVLLLPSVRPFVPLCLRYYSVVFVISNMKTLNEKPTADTNMCYILPWLPPHFHTLSLFCRIVSLYLERNCVWP